MAAILIVSLLPWAPATPAKGAGGSFGGGDGSAGNPYIIEDVWDLQNMSLDHEAHYALGNDIDASATAGWNSGAGFVPIALGNTSSHVKASFDGRNHIITGLFIDRPTKYDVGLFGSIKQGASVRNMTLTGCDVTGSTSVGGLVGSNEGTVSNCHAEGTVTGTSHVGGLVGSNIVAQGQGLAQTGLDDALQMPDSGTDGMILTSGAAGNVTCTGDYVGGLVGENYAGWITDCYATANVTGAHYVGGLVGAIWGGLWGCDAGRVANSYYPVDEVSVNGGHDLTIGAIHDAQWKDWSSGGHRLNVSEYPNLVPSGGCYGIGNVSALRDLLGFAEDTAMRIRQTADLDLSSDPGFFIPYLGAEFDGADHTISDLDLDMPSASYLGMFGYCGGGTIANTSLVDEVVSGYSHIGGLAGVDDGGTVSTSHATGEVTGGDVVGGLVGYIGSGTMIDSSAACAVSGGEEVGGLIGSNIESEVAYSYATGNVSGSGMNVGGFLGVGGTYGGRVDNCHATGNVCGTSHVGGLVGQGGYIFYISYSYATGNVKGTNDYVGGLMGTGGGFEDMLDNCHATGNVTGADHVGGLAGSGGGSRSYATGDVTGVDYVGGLMGNTWGISQCFATGDVTGNGTYVGGCVGFNGGTVQDSYARGTVTRSSGTGQYFGGFMGFNHQGKVLNCYSVGAVAFAGGTDPADKGFAGGVDTGGSYGMTGDFWDAQTSKQASTSGNAAGRTTAEMRAQRTFTNAGWDFTNVWFMVEDVTYPVFQWQDILHPIADAGSDQTVWKDTVVTFDGRGSSDYFGIANYSWTFRDGEPRTVYGVGPAYKFDNPGIFNVTLKVTNVLGNWDYDTMTVTVNDIAQPVSSAGPDQIVDEGTLVTFNGRGSSSIGGIVNYTWTFTDGTSRTLHGAQPTYRFDNPGTFVVTLSVRNRAGYLATDAMTVTVRDITPPTAEAGPDQSIGEGTLVAFDGNASSDNVAVVIYTWTFFDGAPVTLYGARPTYRFDHPGTFLVTLTVADQVGHRDADTMSVTVNDTTRPVAVAGGDAVIDQGDTFLLNGSASTDNVGIVSWAWSFRDGDDRVELDGRTAAYTFDYAGAFEIELTVKDAAGNSDSARFILRVRDTVPPVADAGPDRTVDEDSVVVLDGHLSHDNLGVVIYTWTFRYGADIIVLGGVAPSFTFWTPGVYIITLNIKDAAGHWGLDEMTLTVRDVTPPVADAGPDRTVPVGSSVQLDGSLSKDNVRIADYTWTFTYDGRPLTLNGAEHPFTFAEGGIYEVVLTVRDTSGNLGNDSVVIKVAETGRVSGTVLDGDGRPVDEAAVEIWTSDGKSFTTSTAPNGSFALDVHHGQFTWSITKDGYRAISGASYVGPMEETVLDLSDTPLVKLEERGPSTPLYLLVAIVIATVVVAAALVLRTRRKGGRLGEG